MNSDSGYWPAPAGRRFDATVYLPGSKSLTNRELVLAALATGPTHLVSPLRSRDSDLMIQALEALGTRFDWQGDDLIVHPHPLTGGISIDCGLAGTVMRFVPPMAMLAAGEVKFDGDEGARRRPMQTTIDSLAALGAKISDSTSLPFSVFGTSEVEGGELEIDASASSQFVSGLLLSAARFKDGLTLTHIGKDLPSQPHIEMTLKCLQDRGVNAIALSETKWRVEPGEISGGEIVIEPDLSNAGPFLAAAMVTGSTITIPNWPTHTTQVGSHYTDLLTQMGADVSISNNELTLKGNGVIIGIDVDLSEAGELTPTIAALAAIASSPSKISGIKHLRGHETDRISALASEINRVGSNAIELEDGLEITPGELVPAKWRSYHDHRMATAGAIVGLKAPGLEVENIETTSKTMPGFEHIWQRMLDS
ncbi:MAG TPA: 3-phosphoshikimate 1-carboxyvinyltransferase [Aquiluna sp.]